MKAKSNAERQRRYMEKLRSRAGATEEKAKELAEERIKELAHELAEVADGVRAGRKSFLAGRIPRLAYASASSPLAGVVGAA